jgi:L-seryl-tRNA(Ser) seleniumtransferase
MKRRDILKGLTVLPLAGSVLGSVVPETVTAAPAARGGSKRDFFKELGVTPIINAQATMTFLSGSLMVPETLEAINATAHSFANMYELQAAVGKKISEMLGCESGLVSSGCAGAILLGTAACITGKDNALIRAMPNVPGPQREVIKLTNHRYGWDSIMRTAGVKIVYVKDADEMEKAFNANTVMMQYNNGASRNGMTYEEFVAIAKKHNIPTMIDIAADVPPAENLFKFQKIGFDLICLSGGKMLRGPQSAGLLFGKKDLIDAAMLNNSPYEVPIGRPCKVNKEEIFGMYAALKSFVERDHDKEWQGWLDRIKRIATTLEKVPTVKAETRLPAGPTNNIPGMSVTWDQTKVKITAEQVTKAMKDGTPSIQAQGRGNALSLGVVLMQEEEVDIVAKRVREILEGAIVKVAKS